MARRADLRGILFAGGARWQPRGPQQTRHLGKDAGNASFTAWRTQWLRNQRCHSIASCGLGFLPVISRSLPGKRLQTRVSWTAGVESISSQLFGGTLRGKYGKSQQPGQATRLTLEVCPAPGNVAMILGVSHSSGPFCQDDL